MTRSERSTTSTPSRVVEAEPPRGVMTAVELIVAGLLLGVVSLAAAPADAAVPSVVHSAPVR